MTPCPQVRYVFSDPSLTSYLKCILRLVIAVDDASSTWAPLYVYEVNGRHIFKSLSALFIVYTYYNLNKGM